MWALGVLLYRLCYYTTPFEEHGSLAILNVSYKTPPFPIYSNDMSSLICESLASSDTMSPTLTIGVSVHAEKARDTEADSLRTARQRPPDTRNAVSILLRESYFLSLAHLFRNPL